MAGASKFGGTENGADCSKCGGTVAVLFKTRNGTSLVSTLVLYQYYAIFFKTEFSFAVPNSSGTMPKLRLNRANVSYKTATTVQ